MRTARLLVLVAPVLLAACMRPIVNRVDGGSQRPKVPTEYVSVYRTADQVPGRYEEVGILGKEYDLRRIAAQDWRDDRRLVANLRFQSGQLGANAIVLHAESEPRTGARLSVAAKDDAERRERAIAIFVLPAADRH